MDIFVGPNYRLERKIGRGAHGLIYLGTNIYTGEWVAVKLELQTARNPKLSSEYKIYRILAGGDGISRVHWFGKAGKYNALVLDVLGPSLYDLFKFCGKKFTLKTVSMLADQLLTRVEYMHSKNFIHRDIKPANFVMGLDMQELNKVYMIDFGLSKSYIDSETGQHIKYVNRRSFTGTVRYASVNAHRGMEQSRRDDLESVGYALIYFALGSLPWQNVEAKTKKKFHLLVMQKKMNTPVEILCRRLPTEFATYLNYCRTLRFNEKPDYKFLRKLFRKLFFRQKYCNDCLFDWTIQNNKLRSMDRKMMSEYEGDSMQDTKSPQSKETKLSDKSKYRHDESYAVTPQNEYCMKVLEKSIFI